MKVDLIYRRLLFIFLFSCWLYLACEIYFIFNFSIGLRVFSIVLWILSSFFIYRFKKGSYWLVWLLPLAYIVLLGVKACLPPMVNKNWISLQQRQARVEWYSSDKFEVSNFRQLNVSTGTNIWEIKKFKLSDLESVNYIIVPFSNGFKEVAHVILEFIFKTEESLCVSVEARLEQSESYHPFVGLFDQFELIYTIGSWQDILGRRLYKDKDPLLFYKAKGNVSDWQKLLTNILRRTNQLLSTPEYYHTFKNSCSINFLNHLAKVNGRKYGLPLKVILPGMSAGWAFKNGFLKSDQPSGLVQFTNNKLSVKGATEERNWSDIEELYS